MGKPAVVICRATPVAPDPRVDKIARSLSGAGHHAMVLGWDMSGEFPDVENSGNIPYYRCHVHTRSGRGLNNVPNQFRWQVALLAWLVANRKRFDIIHACDFDTVLPALVVKLIFGKKVIYDIFDFYVDMLSRTPEKIKKFIRAIDIMAINRVDAVILADDARKEQIKGSHPKITLVIYNCPEDLSHKLDPLPLEDKGYKLKIAYVGNLQIQRGLLFLLEVLSEHPEWMLDLAGFGPDEEQIIQEACRLQNVHWYGRVPFDIGLNLSHSADVLIATYDPAIPNHRYSSANKIFEAMMLRKPVIVARGTNMDRLVEEQRAGFVVDYGKTQALAEALRGLENKEWRQRLGDNARLAFERIYNWEAMKARLLNLYQNI
jgi:glycosyltransferase involved in cell wall biosynthesis